MVFQHLELDILSVNSELIKFHTQKFLLNSILSVVDPKKMVSKEWRDVGSRDAGNTERAKVSVYMCVDRWWRRRRSIAYSPLHIVILERESGRRIVRVYMYIRGNKIYVYYGVVCSVSAASFAFFVFFFFSLARSIAFFLSLSFGFHSILLFKCETPFESSIRAECKCAYEPAMFWLICFFFSFSHSISCRFPYMRFECM